VYNNAVIIDNSLNNNNNKNNREKLIAIIECILLCGYQKIVLRSIMKVERGMTF